MKSVNPKPLIKGDTIGLVSPSSPILAGAMHTNASYLKQLGFNLKLGKHINDSNRFLAGSDEDRAKDIMDFFKDPDIKAIIATRGGQGSQRLLPLLDYESIVKNPKILMGFSDTTALQLGVFKKTGLISYTGFTLTTQLTSFIKKTFISCLLGEPYSINEGETVNPGIVKGPIVGGNLSLISSLMGTPYQPNFNGKILLLEEVAVEPFNIDRMLSHLQLAGIFDQISGLIFGQFTQCISNGNPYDGTIDEVIIEWASRFKGPCLKNFPYGHGDKSCVLPLGKMITLDTKAISINIY